MAAMSPGVTITAVAICPNLSNRLLVGIPRGIFRLDETTSRWDWVFPPVGPVPDEV